MAELTIKQTLTLTLTYFTGLSLCAILSPKKVPDSLTKISITGRLCVIHIGAAEVNQTSLISYTSISTK